MIDREHIEDKRSLTEQFFDKENEKKVKEFMVEFSAWLRNNWLIPENSGYWVFERNDIDFTNPFEDLGCKDDSIFTEAELVTLFNNKEGEF
jgi:hypothetical protein